MFFVFVIKSVPTNDDYHPNLRTTGDYSTSLVNLVDVFYGTGVVSSSLPSTGNLFPIAARPFGNNHWTVTTNANSPWFFDRQSSKFHGIRCTHQPSPWIGDYAFFDLAPSKGAMTVAKYDFSPSVINVIFVGGSSMTLVPTATGAVLTFSGINEMFIKRLKYQISDDYTIIGSASETSIYKAPRHTILHVVIKSSTAIRDKLAVSDKTVWRIGTSFISAEQAFINIPKAPQRALIRENNRIWDQALGRLAVSGGGDRAKFYTILYRTLLFPRMLKEPTGRHYSPYSDHGSNHAGELSTDSGFWDAYRTVYPLLHLVYPDYARTILNGWVNAIKESPDGMLAQWASPGKVDSMEGAMGEISISEGIMNNAIDDVDAAWGYLYKSCFTNKGRASFDVYHMLGYVPDQVSLSLNYYLSDYVVSLAARKLGHLDMANTLERRSRNWRLIFDKEKRMFGPRTEKGVFKSYQEYKWMGPFREGGAWQYRFYVPHDPEGLDQWGYDGEMCDYLRDTMTNDFKPKNLRTAIHEEKELYGHMFGQYAHNNQPVHHVLHMFYHVGCKEEGDRWIKKVLDESYTDKGYPGDEDNGEMSAWYILSSIGLYSLVPGSLTYQVSSEPQWDVVDIDHGRVVITKGGGEKQTSLLNYRNNMRYRLHV